MLVTELRVAHVNCVVDPENRAPSDLLKSWPTLPAVAAATARAGGRVTVFQASRFADQFSAEGVEYQFVPCRFPWHMGRAIAAHGADVIHFNGLDFPIQLRALSRLRTPILVQDHASTASGRSSWLRRWGYARAAAVAFTSVEQAVPFVQAGQLNRKIALFGVPESSTDFTPSDRAVARARTGVYGDPALLWVGHLDHNKDPLTVLAAARQAAETLPDLQLWYVFGKADLLPAIERELRKDPQLAQRVHLVGSVAHGVVETMMCASDFFVLASHREGSGYALIEALACGLPPIVTDIPSFAWLTDQGRIGALAAVGNADQFAAGILRLVRRPRRQAREGAREHFERHLSFPAVGTRLMQVYRAIMQPGQRL